MKFYSAKQIALTKIFKEMSVSKKITLSIFLLAMPIVIYWYFVPWQTHSLHDDDLFIFRNYINRHGFFQQINVSTDFGQFRPIRDLFLHFVMQIFGKNTSAIYLVNVFVQSVNAVIFAFVLNVVFRSFLLSVGFATIYALSRFSFYSLTQLFNGGPLEGLAMTFFLLCLYNVVKLALAHDSSPKSQVNRILLSILFANLVLYTHERYVALFPFLILFILFFPTIMLKRKAKIALSLLAAASPVINGIAKTFFSLRLFMGTAYQDVKFSLVDAIRHYFTELCSLFQFNFGVEYLIGLPYERLTTKGQWLVKMSAFIIILMFAAFVISACIRMYREKKSTLGGADDKNNLILFISLFLLMSLLIGPAVVQVRMELRWLQAPLCVFLLMNAIVLTRLGRDKKILKSTAYLLILVSFLYTNYYYVYNGSKNLYYSTSARIGDAFDSAITNGSISLGKNKLYICEKKRNLDREGEIQWALCNGYFFSVYNSDSMQLVFVDSLYSRGDSVFVNSFPDLDTSKQQIVFLDIQNDDQTFKYTITNTTGEYLSDSLKARFDWRD